MPIYGIENEETETVEEIKDVIRKVSTRSEE